MTKEEITKRFCKFELCTHRNGEGTCCLFNQDNCIFHRLEKENEQLKEQIEKMKCCYNCSKWYDGDCEESPKSKTFFCADFKCDKWECIE